MVPALEMVPALLMVPSEMSMVPVALFVRVSPLLIVRIPFMVIVFVESLVKEPLVPIISSEPLSIVKVPVVSVNGIFSVTVTNPSMIISSEPIGSTSSLQLSGSDQTSAAPSPSHEITQVSTGWFPVIGLPIITPLQSLFIVPLLLSMVPDVLSMVPELLIVPILKMPKPAVFDIVMRPELSMIPPESLLMPILPLPEF